MQMLYLIVVVDNFVFPLWNARNWACDQCHFVKPTILGSVTNSLLLEYIYLPTVVASCLEAWIPTLSKFPILPTICACSKKKSMFHQQPELPSKKQVLSLRKNLSTTQSSWESVGGMHLTYILMKSNISWCQVLHPTRLTRFRSICSKTSLHNDYSPTRQLTERT